jgi:hypothetical protein
MNENHQDEEALKVPKIIKHGLKWKPAHHPRSSGIAIYYFDT